MPHIVCKNNLAQKPAEPAARWNGRQRSIEYLAMDLPICRLRAADFDELIAFLARAFAKPEPDWFVTNMGNVYQPTDAMMHNKLAIRRDGRIVAALGVFPIIWHIGQATLRIAGISGVACDPDCRGSGFMGALMDEAMRIMPEEKYPVAWLDGQRRRYGRWGFERAGTRLHLPVDPATMRRQSQAAPAVRLEELGKQAALEPLKAMYDAQFCRCQRATELFGTFLRFHRAQPYVAYDSAGELCGYISAAHGEMIDLAARDCQSGVQIAQAAVEKLGRLNFNMVPSPLASAVAAFAEDVAVVSSGNWQILDWAGVLQALLEVRHATESLPPGEVILGIDGRSENVRLRVDASGVLVENTTQAADLKADAQTMTRALFGPASPPLVLPLPARAGILGGWCPLPLAFNPADSV